MHIFLTGEEMELVKQFAAAEVDAVTTIVHLFMTFGANYERIPETENPEGEPEIIDMELADEFAGALIATDYAVEMKREVSEVE